MGRYVLLLGLAVLTACAPSAKDLAPALRADQAGTVRFSPDGATVLSGDLRFPRTGSPVPAVILMHGCAGLGNAETGWVEPLRAAGYATFVVDSLTGRGLSEVCTNALKLLPTQRIADAYAALKIMATHPRIDARRIVLMGFSHGGVVALGSATTWARDRFAPPGGPTFRAFLPFYPYCNTRFPEIRRLAGPVRIHTGDLDDWTPARPCQELVGSVRPEGNDIGITIYRGAHHSFDNVGRPLTYLSTVDNPAACRFELRSIVGPLPAREEVAACLRKGATIAWNPAATEAARKNVLAELADLLK